MDNLFSDIERYKRNVNAPLAVRMRPQTLSEYVGQAQAVGPDSWLRRAIEHDVLSSVILYGPAVMRLATKLLAGYTDSARASASLTKSSRS